MRTRMVIPKRRLIEVAIVGAITILSSSAGVSCGYHNDVSLARGVLNWVYPEALHVIGAITRAVGEKRLPTSVSTPSAFGPRGYQTTTRSLDRLAQQMSKLSGETPPPPFSLVLIEPMLWTRFVPEGGELRTQVHSSGPVTGYLVVISGESVVHEVADNRLTIGEANRLGLIRFYGTGEQITSFLIRYDRAGSPHFSASDVN